jgi:hypothetical protein
MGIICPYCDIEVSESAIEAEGGCCPECGSIISAAADIYYDSDDDEDQDVFEDSELGRDMEFEDDGFDDDDPDGDMDDDEN